MELTSTAWQQVKGGQGTWSMELDLAKQMHSWEIAEYPRFSRALSQLSSGQMINMAWNQANGVWEWEIEGWNWPWEDESEGANGDGTGYGTGYRRDAGLDGSNRPCSHEWVNISFNHLQLACKHCGIDKPN